MVHLSEMSKQKIRFSLTIISPLYLQHFKLTRRCSLMKINSIMHICFLDCVLHHRSMMQGSKLQYKDVFKTKLFLVLTIQPMAYHIYDHPMIVHSRSEIRCSARIISVSHYSTIFLNIPKNFAMLINSISLLIQKTSYHYPNNKYFHSSINFTIMPSMIFQFGPHNTVLCGLRFLQQIKHHCLNHPYTGH